MRPACTRILWLTIVGIALASCEGSSSKSWNIAVGDGGGSTQEALGKRFAELVRERTAGEYDITLFVNGQLGSEQATVVDASMGTLDFAIVGSNNLAPFSPTLSVLSLPYVFENSDQTRRVIEGPIARKLAENTLRDANVRILAWTYSGFRVLTNSRRPVTAIGDLEGLIIRVPKNEVMIENYRSWGINPTPLAWSETFPALQQKVVDGQDSPILAIRSMKFGEIQQYLTQLHYMFQLEPLIVSESLFRQLPTEVQGILVEAGIEATTYSFNWLQQQEQEARNELTEQYGMQIDVLTDEDEWARRARERVWPKFYDQVGGKGAVDELLRTIAGNDGKTPP